MLTLAIKILKKDIMIILPHKYDTFVQILKYNLLYTIRANLLAIKQYSRRIMTMNKKPTHLIYCLTEWIEKNLHSDINIDSVAKKSGYSKRHIQYVFKYVTGRSIGEYIRTRRLTKSAILVIFTKRKLKVSRVSWTTVHYNHSPERLQITLNYLL